jgi:hypothetical protein
MLAKSHDDGFLLDGHHNNRSAERVALGGSTRNAHILFAVKCRPFHFHFTGNEKKKALTA